MQDEDPTKSDAPCEIEPLPPTGWRCEFAAWRVRGDGSAVTRLKPDLFLTSWLVANLVILALAWTQPPSLFSSCMLSLPSGGFALHAAWLLLRRPRLWVSPREGWIRGGNRLGGQRRELSTQGLRAIQLLRREPETAADGGEAEPPLQAVLLFESAGRPPRREALAEARPGTAEDVVALARGLVPLLGVDLLDLRTPLSRDRA